ncbi:hypothetical protein Rumeso_04024 [Rubellimicrobium mesophilum DSM 19309]|uniref:Uncharacterized protein n=1 Tax=Rubellimicrobium mesophilum DSM 19309 TaxID=442562 RepID=A0A017HIT8_9RHOB|nr:hypothetical protein Rumeso_04024 [Rubellimicrobium mesophilum DSM 19309]
MGLGGAALAEESTGLEPTWFSPLPEVFFAAPTGLTLQEYGPDWVSIGTPSLENGFLPEVDVHAFQGGPSEGSPDFETFALAALRNTCAADGPGETIHCDAVRHRQPFTSDSGLEGEILYLDRVHETWDPASREVTVFGQIFLFDLSGKTNGEEWIALVVQPVPTLELDAIDDQLLADIARTVEVATGPIDGG